MLFEYKLMLDSNLSHIKVVNDRTKLSAPHTSPQVQHRRELVQKLWILKAMKKKIFKVTVFRSFQPRGHCYTSSLSNGTEHQLSEPATANYMQ